MLFVIAALTALLLWVGIEERHEIGPIPIILAVLWAIFVLVSATRIFSQDDSH